MTDFRALCDELVDAITAHAYPDKDAVGYVAGLLTRARTALAEPEAEEPTIPSRYRGHEIAVYRDGFHAGYKEALARAALAKPVIPVKQRVFPTPSQAAECGGPCYEGNYCPEACDCGLYQPPLSPAAQAVLDAFTADNYGVWLEGDPDRIAAALRAVAQELKYFGITEKIILAIANELENTNG